MSATKMVAFQAHLNPDGQHPRRVPGEGIPVAPGLLIGHSFPGGMDVQSGPFWRFHHTDSGFAFGWFRSRAAISKAAPEIAALTDWTKSQTAIRRKGKMGLAERVYDIIGKHGGWR